MRSSSHDAESTDVPVGFRACTKVNPTCLPLFLSLSLRVSTEILRIVLLGSRAHKYEFTKPAVNVATSRSRNTLEFYIKKSRGLPRKYDPSRPAPCFLRRERFSWMDTNTILFLSRAAFPAASRRLSFALRRTSSRKLFLAAFFSPFAFPPPLLPLSRPYAPFLRRRRFDVRHILPRYSYFRFYLVSTRELFARVSIDMSFRSYLVLHMHTAQTAGNGRSRREGWRLRRGNIRS